MTRERRTHLATVAVLILALGAALGQKTGWRFGRSALQPASPQDAIYGMLDAARSGNVTAYLARYTGPMLASLQASVRETTETAFSAYLRDSQSAIKGVAVIDPQVTSDREASVRVEYVYQDRNEVQIMRLEKADGQWRIASVDGAERVKTLVPYGTPVR
jgi:putative IMPACT (imprinted ancient) family translation regulator